MIYDVKEFYLDDRPNGRDLIGIIEDNNLGSYELDSIEPKTKPHNPYVLEYGSRQWYIVRFRKREDS